MTKRRGLGRNLNALIGDAVELTQNANTTPDNSTLRELPIEQIQRGQYQPRTHLDPQALAELTASIKEQGVIQPIVVRPISNHRYEIIAGERRWRATQQAGLTTIPAVVKEIPDQTALAVALIENIQRQNLSAIEEANALARLKEEFDMTDEAVATVVGRQRSSVTNLLRLLNLNEKVQQIVERGELSMGHARALLGLPREQQPKIARNIIDGDLSVRQTEQLVQQTLLQRTAKFPVAKVKDPNVLQLERRLAEMLGAPVTVDANAKGRGKILINFNNLEQLQGILDRIETEEV